MERTIPEFLWGHLSRGPCRLAEVLIRPDFTLRHFADADRSGLERFSDPHDALLIARYDDDGNYRPLKTAPNLRHGWLLELGGLEDAVLALDFLYPAALGTAVASGRGELQPVDLRQTLARQSGMYAVVRKLSDSEATSLIDRFCDARRGCLRRILWSVSPGEPSPAGQTGRAPASADEIPIYCAEACNLLVAAGREIVKRPS